MIAILEDDGNRLKIWVRKSIRNLQINPDSPDIIIGFSVAKKIARAGIISLLILFPHMG